MDAEIRRRSFAFNLRPGERNNRGRIQERRFETTPQTILGSLAWWYRADDPGITIGTGVSGWPDKSGNAVHLAQGTGTLQPAFLASAINGRPAVQGDGVDDFLAAAWARAAPLTQPFYIWLILRQDSFTSGETFLGDFAANGLILEQRGASPNLDMFNGSIANANGGAAIGAFARVEYQFTGSALDYCKAGAAAATTGASAGNNAGGGTLRLFQGGSGAGAPTSVSIAEAFCFLGTPSGTGGLAGGGQRAALDAYGIPLYGSAPF